MKGFKRQIMYDLRAGIFQYWKQYSMLFLCFLFLHSVLAISYQGEKTLSYVDYIWNFLKGIPQFAGADRNQSFSMPVEWLILHLGCMIMNLKYSYTDLYEKSVIFFLYSESRKKWWFSKCIWVFLHTSIYYSLFWLSAIGSSIFFGNFHYLTMQKGAICMKELIEMNIWMKIVLVFLVPLCIAIAVGMIVLFLSIFWSPLGTMITILGIYIASAYWEQSLLIGNYSMLMRCQWIRGEGAITPIKGILLSFIVILFISILGGNLIQRQEVYKKGRA